MGLGTRIKEALRPSAAETAKEVAIANAAHAAAFDVYDIESSETAKRAALDARLARELAEERHARAVERERVAAEQAAEKARAEAEAAYALDLDALRPDALVARFEPLTTKAVAAAQALADLEAPLIAVSNEAAAAYERLVRRGRELGQLFDAFHGFPLGLGQRPDPWAARTVAQRAVLEQLPRERVLFLKGFFDGIRFLDGNHDTLRESI
jgi:hypothetical protein